MIRGVLNDPSAWLAEDLAETDRWMHTLSLEEIADLDRALGVAKRAGHSCATLTIEDFPLDRMRPTLDRLLNRLENGLGVFVMRGFPAQLYTKDDLRLLYWGVGLNLGTAVSQSHKGDFLGDVKDFAQKIDPAKWRGYMSGVKLAFHTDTADAVCLFVLQTAKVGGTSMFCSSLAIHDEIARTRPDLLEVLYQPFTWSWMGQEAPGEPPHYQQPIFSIHKGRFASRYLPNHLRSAQKLPGVAAMTAAQAEAIELVQALANDPRFHFGMLFQPGDFQFLNNHITYHARTEFEDYPEPERRRHLLRMWLSLPNTRELSAGMAAIYRDQRGGTVRGGFPSRVDTPLYETIASDL